jgi:protein disulfide isomerase family A protein 3
VPLVTVFAAVDFLKNPKGYQYLANRISKLAKEYVNKAVFVISDKTEYSNSLTDYGLPDLEGKRDVGYGLKIGDMHYKSNTDSLSFSADILSKFVKDYFAGSLQGKLVEASAEPLPPSEGDYMYDVDDDVSLRLQL